MAKKGGPSGSAASGRVAASSSVAAAAPSAVPGGWTTYDPGAKRRRRLGRLFVIACVALVIVIGGGGAAYAWYHQLDTQLHPVSGPLAGMNLGLKAPPPGKPFYMVIMGVDTRATEGGLDHSDTLMVAYVDAARKRMTTMSIPRDTMVDIPGHGTQKINAAMQIGGPQLTIEMVKQLTGLPIGHWAYVDFSGFKSIVDSVGGVEVYVPYTINDVQASGNHPSAKRVKKGLRVLDGAHALTFVRARHQFANQDFTRMRDQQIFLKALAKKMLKVNLLMLPGLANSVSQNVHTDLSIGEIAGLALNFRSMDDKMLQSITMPGTARTIGGVSYVVPDTAALAVAAGKMQRGELFTPVATETTGGATPTPATAAPSPASVAVTVLNGTRTSGLAKLAARRLTGDRFVVRTVGTSNQRHTKSIVVCRTSADAAKARAVAKALGISGVLTSSKYSFAGTVLVVLGSDYRS